MTAVPAQPMIYHIVHVDRLASIIADGGLWSDSAMSARSGTGTTIGMGSIKQRRLRLPVDCHPGTWVGDYVPFYFCPRSIMLYVIHCANHPELSYRSGQEPIVHLEADLRAVVTWANASGVRWAFSLANAGAVYTSFRSDLAHLSDLDWTAIAARDFRPAPVKEAKQAEFLLHQSFPWHLFTRIGVRTQAMAQRVATILNAANHRPALHVRPDWYY